MPERTRTANAEQARLLLAPQLDGLLRLLSRCPQGAAELSAALNQPLSTVHARLQRLLQADVLEEAALLCRAGRPVRRYQLPLPWIVPFEITPAATLRDLLASGFQTRLETHMDALAQVMVGLRTDWVIQLGNDSGEWEYNLRQRDRPARPQSVFVRGTELRLGEAQRLELGRRLSGLMDEFQAQSSPDEPEWLFTVLFTPSG